MRQPSVPEKAALLATLPLFSPLSPEQGLHLAAHCTWHHWPRNTPVFHEGEQAHGMHIVLQGLIKIFHTTADGRERVLHLIKPGNTCGEAAVFQRGTYPANATTLATTTALSIPSAPLLAMICSNPGLALNMLAALSLRLRMFTRKLEAHSSGDATQRLAAYLLHRTRLSNSPIVQLDVPREVLANMLGIARETLSRTFSRLQHAGILTIAGRTITIHRLETLQQVAEESGVLPQPPQGA